MVRITRSFQMSNQDGKTIAEKALFYKGFEHFSRCKFRFDLLVFEPSTLCILSTFSEALEFLWIYKGITSHLNTNGSELKGDSFSALLFFEPTTYAAICSSMVIPPFKTITSFPSGITRIHSISLRTTISLYSEKLISVSARNALILSIS